MTSIEELRRLRRATRDAVPRASRRELPPPLIQTDSPKAPVVRDVPRTESVGTELKSLLQRFGISPSEGCQCNNIAAEMDHRGAAWCEQNLDRLAGQMTLEARRRQWSLLQLTSTLGLGGVTEAVARQAAKWLILEAIRRARHADGVASLSALEGGEP